MSCAWYYFIVNDLTVFLAHAVVVQDTSVNVVHNLKMFLLCKYVFAVLSVSAKSLFY